MKRNAYLDLKPFHQNENEDAPSDNSSEDVLNQRQITMIMLLAQVCSLYDPTPKTFVVNILRFYELGLVTSVSFLKDLGLLTQDGVLSSDHSDEQTSSLVPNKYYVDNAIATLVDGTKDFSAAESLNVSRYQREFVQLNEIGSGAFGIVFTAKHVVDGNFYAVKKISFRNKGYQDPLVQNAMREVKYLALCDHPNVTRYYAAWLEPTWLTNNVDSTNVTFNIQTPTKRKLIRDIHDMVQASPDSDESYYDRFSNVLDDDDCISFGRVSMESNDIEENSTIEVEPDSAGGFTYEITLYIQMHLCDTSTLRDVIDKRNNGEMEISFATVLSFFGQLVNGLAHIHRKGIIHRDLKPRNIFLGQDEYDDKSSNASPNAFQHTSGLGTIAYASPEQLNSGESYDCRVDTFSLGVILLELLCPFQTGMERAAAFRDIRSNTPKLPNFLQAKYPNLVTFIEKLVKFNANERPTAAELQNHPMLQNKDQFALQQKIILQAKVIDEQKLSMKKMEAEIKQLRKRLADSN